MKNNKQILAIIPARGGSKGIPRKNIRMLAGKPLIAWTIATALSVPCLDRIILSTDDEEIRRTGELYGAAAPFLRPAKIAGDDTTDMPVYEHALNWLGENEQFFPDIIVWLRPTTPFRNRVDVEMAIDILLEKKTDWVRSVCEVEHHPYWMYKPKGETIVPFVDGITIENYIRRQLLPPVYRLNGAVDVTWRSTILEKKLLYTGVIAPYIMPINRSMDIDTKLDLEISEMMMTRNSDE